MRSEIDRARSALHAIDSGGDRTAWVRAGMAAKAAGLDFDDFDAWSAAAANYGGERDTRAAWRSFRPNGGIGAGTLFAMARAAGWRDSEPVRHKSARPDHALRAIKSRAPDEADLARKRAIAADLWRQAQSIEPGTPAHQYLIGRACVIPPRDGDLRWLPNLRLFCLHGPALVGRISDALDARHGLGLHLTWIAPDGAGWRRIERRYFGPKAGGIIRLWPDETVTCGLGIAEGVESALTLAHAFTPVWCVLDAGNMAALPALGIEALLIAADHDDAGIKAARACAERWARAGREVAIAMPPTERTDVNDLARAA